MDTPAPVLLITGFVPFPQRSDAESWPAVAAETKDTALPSAEGPAPPAGRCENPSQTLALALAHEVERVTVLPVSWSQTLPALEAAWAGATHWLGLGLSARVRRPTLECVALNIAYSPVPDNDGTIAERRRLDPQGALATEVGFDPEAAQRAVARRGATLDLSHHAGTYLCNSVLYAGLRARQRGTLRQAAFVHIPPVSVGPADCWRPAVSALARWLRKR